jgi:glycosyltransferase involved in cell wall biosynthesis
VNPGKITVVIPTYNREKLLPRAIESVLRQTRPADEIIIVDDGSTDNTAEIVIPYESRVRYLKKQNGGPSSARNFGLESSSGEFIAFLDSDDAWLPEMLETTIPMFEKYPSAGVIFTDACWRNEQQVLEPAMNHGFRRKAFEKLLGIAPGFCGCIDRKTFRRASFSMCLMLQSAVVFRTDLFRKIGNYNERYRVAEDYELWLRLSRVYDVAYVDSPLVVNYIDGTNLSGTAELKETFLQNNRNLYKSELAVEEDESFRVMLRQSIRNQWESEITLRLRNGNLTRLRQTLAQARDDGWHAGERSMRRIKIVDRLGPLAGLTFCRLLKLFGREGD